MPTARPPVLAIVGRPNVGKSTLLNALARSRVAIVEETAGVTRDRVGVLCTYADRTVEVVDTGGIGIVDLQGLEQHVEGQVGHAVRDADVILFVTDAREGRTPLDERVGRLLRGASAPVILLANKAESDRSGWDVADLAGLGYGAARPISAKERIGLAELEEVVAGHLPPGPTTERRLPAPELKVAVVGRVNAGKSSLVNGMLRSDRMIVSEVPGTTRDSVDVRFEHEGRALVVIDTAGIRKERVVQDSVEFYAQRRAERAMRRADVAVLVLDVTSDVGRLDRQIAAYAVEHHHPVVVAANKWDLRPEGFPARAFRAYVHKTLPGLRFAPLVFTSAAHGRGLDRLFERVWALHTQAETRVGTSAVNKALEAAQALRAPRPRHGRRGQVYYGTQVAVNPPTFVLFVNDVELFDSNWMRYLENRFREDLPFPNVPLKFILRPREREGRR